jgi:hypothetical protein
MFRRIVLQVLTDVLEVLAASIIRAQDRAHLWALMQTVMNFQAQLNTEIFLSC